MNFEKDKKEWIAWENHGGEITDLFLNLPNFLKIVENKIKRIKSQGNLI